MLTAKDWDQLVADDAPLTSCSGKRLVDDPQKMLSELARLGARLIIQRAVEDEFEQWLGRGRYERRPECERGLRNYESELRNGFRPRRVQTAEGELRIEIPQVRDAAEPSVSRTAGGFSNPLPLPRAALAAVTAA